MYNSKELNDLKISGMPMPAPLDYDGDSANPETMSPNPDCGNTCEKLMCASNDAICLCLCRSCDNSIGRYKFNINFNEKIAFRAAIIEDIFRALKFATKCTFANKNNDIVMVKHAIMNGVFNIENSHEASFCFDITSICNDEDDIVKYKKALIHIMDAWMNELTEYAKMLS